MKVVSFSCIKKVFSIQKCSRLLSGISNVIYSWSGPIGSHSLILSLSIPNHLIVSPLFQSSVTRSFNLRFKMLNDYIFTLFCLFFQFLLHQASILVPGPNAPKFRLTFNQVFTKFKLQTRPTTTQSCNFYKNLSTFPWAPSCSSCANGFHGEILFNSLIIRSQINQLCFNLITFGWNK